MLLMLFHFDMVSSAGGLVGVSFNTRYAIVTHVLLLLLLLLFLALASHWQMTTSPQMSRLSMSSSRSDRAGEETRRGEQTCRRGQDIQGSQVVLVSTSLYWYCTPLRRLLVQTNNTVYTHSLSLPPLTRLQELEATPNLGRLSSGNAPSARPRSAVYPHPSPNPQQRSVQKRRWWVSAKANVLSKQSSSSFLYKRRSKASLRGSTRY